MIKAKFKWNNLVIDISNIDEKYRENWREIKARLFYGTECTMSSWLEKYIIENETSIIYNWQKEIIIEVSDIKPKYIWRDIEIWYYIELDFWKKLLLFRDTKEVNIERLENNIFYKKDLPRSSKYNYKKDNFSYKKIFLTLWIIRKLFLIFSIILIVLSIYFFIKNIDIWFLPLIFWIIISLITFFTAGRWYLKWKIFPEKVIDWEEFKNIISWKFKNYLEELKIQAYIFNSEAWAYEEDRWSSTVTVHFDKEVWNILLFEKEFSWIKSGTKIEDLLDWKIDLTEIYEKLYPSIEITSSMWLFLNIEFRIISKNFKDIILKKRIFLDEKKFKRKTVLPTNNVKISEKVSNDNNWDGLNDDFFE